MKNNVKRIGIIGLFTLVSILAGCSLNNQESNQPKIIEDNSFEQQRPMRGFRDPNFTGNRIFSGDRQGFGQNLTGKVKELFEKIREARQNGDFTGADEIRKQLQEKYPNMLSGNMFRGGLKGDRGFRNQQSNTGKYDTQTGASSNN